MADIVRYEYEGEFTTLVPESELQEFLSSNTVISYDVYDGASVVTDSDELSDSDIDIIEEE